MNEAALLHAWRRAWRDVGADLPDPDLMGTATPDALLSSASEPDAASMLSMSDATFELADEKPEGSSLFAQLLTRWREPQRSYHTLEHLGECLELFEVHRAMAEHPGEVALALFFHDAIYDIPGADNETRSADWARDALLSHGVAATIADRVHVLVLATDHRQPMPVAAGIDAQLVVDIDLAILGAPGERFGQYERQIRSEYASVPSDVFAQRRHAVLKHFLACDPLYRTAGIHAQREAQATTNLKAALKDRR